MNTRRPPKRIVSLFIGALLSTTFPLAAQQPSQTTAATGARPIYDVISVRENKSDSNNASVRGGGASFVATNINLTTLLMNAYGIRQELMYGLPGWANSTRFDVNAKVSDPDVDAMKNLTRDQRRAMLIALLANRFHFQGHLETKTLPVYDLVIAKGGSKLKENTTLPSQTPDTPSPGKPPANMKPGSVWISGSQMTAVGIPTSNLATNLAFQVQRNVIDKTGLTGKYDINLKWRTEEEDRAGIDTNAPDLFTALQEQLGLKLEPSKGPVDTLVIDHVEMPTEN